MRVGRIALTAAICTILVGSGAFFFSTASFGQSGSAPVPIITHPVGAGPYNENPSPVYVATPDTAVLIAREQIEKQRPADGQVVFTKLMTWGEYQSQYESAARNYQIDPGRKVWVLRTYFPDGHATRFGTLSNLVMTVVYDAQTGAGLTAHNYVLKPGESPETVK